MAPVAVGSIPAQVLAAGQTVTVDVTPFFSDPDGGALTYTASSSAPSVLSVSISGSNLTVEAVAPGTATVTVTATDPDGLTAAQSAEVTVEAANRAPEAVGAIPAQTMTAGQTATVDVSPFFS
ncbi:putative Ig domain-containing protein [Candidatus Palauibacter sp.]|uniref:putative Ig domain-containing protein n=1 Tax=Candidatus Palauibacter sp. TaxID=3101350 RepID=UPI003AF30D45